MIAKLSTAQIKDLFSAALLKAPVPSVGAAPWSFAEIAGRLVELSGRAASLTLAFRWVLEAQRQGEPVGWAMPEESSFYPPDAVDSGVDPGALVVARVPQVRLVARAAERLVRSGAFGLVVLDLGAVAVPTPLQARLVGLAQKHHAALVCLTEKEKGSPSLGSLVSLRIHSERAKRSKEFFDYELKVLKDKRWGPAWSHSEACHGPAGLC